MIIAKGFIKKENIDFIEQYVVDVYTIDVEDGVIYSNRNQSPMGCTSTQSGYNYVRVTYAKNKTKLVPLHWIIGVAGGILYEDQLVSHIDGDKTNNKIENLQIIKIFDYEVSGSTAKIHIENFDGLVLIDTEDIDIVKHYFWRIDKDGYVVTSIGKSKTSTKMHRLIVDCPTGKDVDHKNRVRHDNRKINLRICDRKYNTLNRSTSTDNKSGVSGVHYDSSRLKWCGSLSKEGEKHFKRFDDKEDAVRYRLLLEQKYFKEFAPQKHLYEHYGIYDNQ